LQVKVEAATEEVESKQGIASQLIEEAKVDVSLGSPDSSVASALSTEKEKSPSSVAGTPVKKEGRTDWKDKADELQRVHGKDIETIKDLKNQLKKAQNELKEMKLLLDMYKACTKEQRDKATVMVAEKKARVELEEARMQLKRLGEAKKEEKRRLVDEDAQRKIRQLEEQVAQLQKQVCF
jgi:E3 ubiquitin-protein ligase BRE1